MSASVPIQELASMTPSRFSYLQKTPISVQSSNSDIVPSSPTESTHATLSDYPLSSLPLFGKITPNLTPCKLSPKNFNGSRERGPVLLARATIDLTPYTEKVQETNQDASETDGVHEVEAGVETPVVEGADPADWASLSTEIKDKLEEAARKVKEAEDRAQFYQNKYKESKKEIAVLQCEISVIKRALDVQNEEKLKWIADFRQLAETMGHTNAQTNAQKEEDDVICSPRSSTYQRFRQCFSRANNDEMD